MASPREPNYVIEKHEILAETPDLRMIILTLAPGQEVPWHWHSTVTDTCICLEGTVTLETRAPRASFELSPGQMCSVPPKRAHRVGGKDGSRCKFAVVQGIGHYDYNPVGA
ncbi:MAG TPA: cupin domain-containing protein [Stellaceae bacterium]|nr:cupin domain-containing protein [Stellaceae bacterium]